MIWFIKFVTGCVFGFFFFSFSLFLFLFFVLDCMLTFGMIDKTIRNYQILASSTKLISTLDSFPWDARLKVPYGAWIAGEKDQDQWLQIDFERVMRVRKIATQGHPRYDFWIEKFKLQYSANNTVNGTTYDGSEWETYQEDDASHCTGCERNMTDRVSSSVAV